MRGELIIASADHIKVRLLGPSAERQCTATTREHKGFGGGTARGPVTTDTQQKDMT